MTLIYNFKSNLSKLYYITMFFIGIWFLNIYMCKNNKYDISKHFYYFIIINNKTNKKAQ